MLSWSDENPSAFPRAGGAGLALTVESYNDAVQYDGKYNVHIKLYTGIGIMT